MEQTSLMAYGSLTTTKVGERQRQCLEALEELEVACNRQISTRSGLPINVVTPRMNELQKLGRVVWHGRDKDPVTGMTVNYWRVNYGGKEVQRC